MTMLDDWLDQQRNGQSVQALADEVGLTPQQVESALAGLVRAQGDPADLATMAAAKTGLPVDKVRTLLDRIGGREALGQVAIAMGNQGGPGNLSEWDTPSVS